VISVKAFHKPPIFSGLDVIYFYAASITMIHQIKMQSEVANLQHYEFIRRAIN